MERGSPAADHRWRRLWRYGRALIAPVLIWLLLVGLLMQPLVDWLKSEEVYDQAAMQEWLEEARNADSTLAELVEGYAERVARHAELQRRMAGDAALEAELFQRAHEASVRVAVRREEVYQHLRALGEPVTKMYPGQLPLFPVIYRLEVRFDLPPGTAEWLDEPVVWDSGLEPRSGSAHFRQAAFPLRAGGAVAGRVLVNYQLRAWNKRQRDEELQARRARLVGLLAVAATGLGLAWLMLIQADERESQRQTLLARESVALAERQRVEAERELLEQRLATQAAERKALELKSHLYASIGIMAGSYAHNIKNLLVRPNDLLRRCLERPEAGGEQGRMLREVQQTLGLVTERLQQILQTVRRDPSQSQLRRIDLNEAVGDLARTWGDMAGDRWQLDLVVEAEAGPLWVEADASHLHQAVENLIFNARDATFEMRNYLRDEARRKEGLDAAARRQAVIAAAGWRGRVVVRTRREGDEVVLEVADNGAGMSEEVRRRCTEAHFSTKRDNALYEGHSTGMGLGLSFVATILEGHRARLEIDSRPLGGTTFRVRFPAADRNDGNEDR